VDRTLGNRILLVTASLLLGVPGSLTAAGTAVTAPRDGAVLDTPTFTLSGTLEAGGGPSVKINVNGGPGKTVPVQGGVFASPVTLRRGKNTVTVSFRGGSREAVYEYRSAGGPGTYRFHPGYEEGECAECHASLEAAAGRRRHSDLCYSCHESKENAPFLHGPVGAGQCTFCHDPHGSSEGAFLTAVGPGLCVSCHDQPSSRGHLRAGGGRGCEECHNPHGSQKKFFLD
jgi:predicted CXXCH cytochrome family protein